MNPIDVDAFEVLVAEALGTIPAELRAQMENVAIIIDDESPPGGLYGLYEGIPLTRRGTYAGVSPDRMLAGSEGTLGVVLEAKVKLVPLPNAKAVMVIVFTDLLEALSAAPAALG